MKLSHRLLLPAVLLSAPLSLAQAPAPAPQAEASAPQQNTVSLQYRGSLRDVLQKIAEAGGLNVVVLGTLDTPAEVHLKNVSARQALRTVAKAYSLKVQEDEGIFTIQAAGTEAPAGAAATAPEPAIAPMPGMPPMPPMPPLPPDVVEGLMDDEEVKERMRERVGKVRSAGRGSRDVVARGRSLEVKEGETVDKAVVYGGNLQVNGHVEDDAVVFGGNLHVNGHVEGDAHAFGGNVLLGPDAVVEGDVSSFGGAVLKEDGAKVEGSTESFGGANIGKMVAGELKESLKEARNQARQDARERDEEDEHEGGGFAGFLMKFAVLFGLGFAGQMFFPARMKELGAEIKRQPVLNGVVGFLGAMALIPLAIVLCVTIIGIPVAVALMLAAPVAAALGFSAVAGELGLRVPVLRGRKTQAMVLALGLFILLIVGHIPVLGVLVMIAATLMGFGAVIRTRFGHHYRPRGMPEPIISEQSPV
jgi:cytoskeletal protein CcmA (bactofilin family)